MLRHLLFWLLPPITLYFPTYTYFRQFWVKSQRSITLNNSKTRNGRVHICHSTRCWKSHLASDNYDSRGHFKSENRPKNYYCAPHARLDRRCAYPHIAWLFRHKTDMEDDRYTLQVGERWVNPLPDEASSTKWENDISGWNFTGRF